MVAINLCWGGVTLGGGVDKFSYIFSLYADKKDKFKTPRGIIPFNKTKRQNFYTRLDYDINDDHTLTFDYTYNKSRNIVGGKGQQHDKLPDSTKKILDADPSVYQSANLSYNGKFNDIFSLYATLGAGEQNFNYSYGYNGWGTTDINDYLSKRNTNEMKNKFVYAETKATLNLMPEYKLRMIAGVQSKSTKLDYPAMVNNVVNFHTKEKETYIAPYTQVEYRPIDQILAIAGVRYDRYTYDKSNKKSSTSPRFSLSYFPFAGTNFDYTTIWGSYSEAFNPPAAWHMLGNAFVAANPDVKPEKAKGYEVGLKQRIIEWGNFEISYFHTNYKDMISSKFITGPKRVIFTNIDEAVVKGVESKVEIYPTDWLTLYLGYTALSKKDKAKNQDITGKPGTILQYGVSVDDLNGIYANLQGVQYKKYKNMSSYTANLGEYHPSNNKTIWNFKILYRYEMDNKLVLEPYFGINNLGNQEYYEGWLPNLVEGRTYQAGVSFKMEF